MEPRGDILNRVFSLFSLFYGGFIMEDNTNKNINTEVNETSTFAAKCGKFLGAVIFTCFTACVSAALIALTARFIVWLI